MVWVSRVWILWIGCIRVVVGVKVRGRWGIVVGVDYNGSVGVMPRTIRVVNRSVGVVDGSVRIAGWRRERIVVVVLGIGERESRHSTGCCDEVQGQGSDALK